MNNKSTTALINSNAKSTVINYDNNVDEGIKLIYGDYNNHDNNVNDTINNNSLKTHRIERVVMLIMTIHLQYQKTQ